MSPAKAERYERTKITYDVMIEHDAGTMSGPSMLTDDDGQPLPEYDLGELGPRPFIPGYRSAELAAPTLARAVEYVGGNGRAWIEKVTETVTREEVEL